VDDEMKCFWSAHLKIVGGFGCEIERNLKEKGERNVVCGVCAQRRAIGRRPLMRMRIRKRKRKRMKVKEREKERKKKIPTQKLIKKFHTKLHISKKGKMKWKQNNKKNN
jgi:hypothetical protein